MNSVIAQLAPEGNLAIYVDLENEAALFFTFDYTTYWK